MPSWLSEWVGADMAPLAYYALVAAIILVLILVVLAIARKAMGAGNGPRVKGRGPRLAVMDVASIDQKRRLVLVRRDEIEHLLLIGGQNDLVVEAGILRVPANARTPRAEPQLRPDFEAERTLPPRAAPTEQPAARRPAPAPVAAQPPMPAPVTEAAAAPRAPDQRAPSPLARPVPRPAPARAAPKPAPDDSGRIDPVSSEPTRPAGPAAPVVEPPMTAVEAGPRPEAARAPTVETAIRPQRVEPAMPPIPARTPSAEPAMRVPLVAPPVSAPRSPSRDPIAPMPAEAQGGGAPSQRPASAPMSRAPIAAGSDPARRPLSAQTVQPIQPRSMATPTYPAKPAFAGLAAGGEGNDESPSEGPEAKPAEPSADIVLAKLLAPNGGGASASSPQAPLEPAADPAPAVAPERAPSTSPVEGPAPSSPDGDKRPLSVRSFATAIQTRQASEPTVIAETPAPAPAARRDPVVDGPEAPATSASLVTPVTGTAQPMPAKETGSRSQDDDLEDFLSSQLDSDLDEDIWGSKDANAARPPVPAVAPPVRAVAQTPRVEAQVPPRTPTLEEEMERLLGDFDLETTDRRLR